MRTSNYKVKNIIISVYFVLIMFAVFLLILFNTFGDIENNSFTSTFIIWFIFIALFFLVHFISKYFEYDSDGLKVTVKNKGLLISEYFNYREHTVTFKKSRLVDFKMNNYIIYKELVLFIGNKKDHHINKERFNITLVTQKKRKFIRHSLIKMIKNNSKE
ncbi:hypothetical protein BZARG_100 [Bizionia argentinensis JUB59]|uniref:Uncharacterized protein n=1 Tax=Bizionia argentinensis JUB59 TaxID=1046627 RepID=G2E989_9FLAO|nr:hypothetical protein [Bizionia argentinensis]EGV44888.2 hypothetical protein BZARG_100 [Bizionia argentinensis JUB59]